MAITVEARTEIIALVVGMFGAAPGASVLSSLVASYESGSTISQIAANLSATAEFKSIYPTFLTNGEYATKVVANLLAEASVAAKAEAVTVLTAALNGGMTRSTAMVEAIKFVGATLSTNATFGTSAAAFDNKVEVATYYSVEKQLSGTSLQNLQNVVGAVTSSASTVTTAKANIDVVQNPGGTFVFTTGVDALTGGSGDDVFNAVVTGTSATLGALDVADGGTGNDTLNIVDTSVAAGADYLMPTGLTIKNIENMSVTTNGSLGKGGTTNFDVSSVSGLTSFTGVAAGTGTGTGSQVKAASTTDVKLTVAGSDTATVNGGKSVTVNAVTGVVAVTGAALDAVTVTKGGAVTIDNTSAAGATSVGTSLKSVTLQNEANSAVKGAALTTLNLSGQGTAAARTITVSNGTAAHELTVNAMGTGTTNQTVVTDAAATSVVVNTTATSSIDLSNGTATKTVTLTGSGNLTLATTGAAATKIDGSAATGKLTLGTLGTAVVDVSTGSADDSLSLTATTKATVSTGAGNDTVTLASAVAAGSTINLGAGDDKLLKGAGTVAASSTTTIDAGDGVDTVAAALINAANAAQFKNFENIDVSSTTATALDIELVSGSTITGLTLTGGTGGATVNNVAAGVGLAVSGSNTGTTTIGVKGAATATTDAFTVTFAGAAATTAPTAASIKAGTTVLNGVESVSIASSGGANTWNSIALTDDKLKTVTITGDKNLDLTFVGTNGTNPSAAGGAVSSIDGSAATGKLNINTTNVTADSASAGLTVKGGTAADTITLSQKATVDAGAGTDTIVTSANGGSLTGGAGNDKFDVAASVATGATEATAILVTITDLTAGDSIKLLAGNVGTTIGAKTALDASVTNLDLALAVAGLTNTVNEVSWFQYGSNTYLVANDGAIGFAAGDLVIKIAGLVDLSTSTLDTTTDYLTIV